LLIDSAPSDHEDDEDVDMNGSANDSDKGNKLPSDGHPSEDSSDDDNVVVDSPKGKGGKEKRRPKAKGRKDKAPVPKKRKYSQVCLDCNSAFYNTS
jgi:hypothetical protein